MESAWKNFIHLLYWLKKLTSLLCSPIYYYLLLLFIIYLFLFFDAIKLICAHFPRNNLYLLQIEKYFLGPMLFLNLISFCTSIINIRFSECCGKWHLKQMLAQLIVMSVLTQLHRTEFNSEIVFQPGHDVTFPTS